MASDSFLLTVLSRNGDINGDGEINLVDVIVGLKILAGTPQNEISTDSDVNGDNRIGIEEVIFDLNTISDGN